MAYQFGVLELEVRGRGGNTGIDERTRGERRAGLFGDVFECQVWEKSRWRMGGNGAEEGLSGGTEDSGEDKVTGVGEILKGF